MSSFLGTPFLDVGVDPAGQGDDTVIGDDADFIYLQLGVKSQFFHYILLKFQVGLARGRCCHDAAAPLGERCLVLGRQSCPQARHLCGKD